jgi:peptidoglycan glycosyltransferase
VLVQLVNIQYRQANALANSPQNPRVAVERFDNPRGDIVAADGTVLAQSTKVSSAAGEYQYQRSYPTAGPLGDGSLYSQIVGYDSYNYGKTGVELEYDSYLSPHRQKATNLEELLHPVTSTDDVTLTVQPYLQQLAQQQLGGRDGAVVVLNPSTGAVEAMYSNPTFNPTPIVSPYATVETLGRLAETTRDANGLSGALPLTTSYFRYPGSTFKVVDSAAVYDFKPLLAFKSYPYVSSVTFTGSNKPFHNDSGGPCGGTLTEMLPPSCDTGYALVGLDLGAPTLIKQAEQFGFNQVPPIDVPGAVASPILPESYLGKPVNAAFLGYTAVGQYGVQATALQMAMVVSALANKGTLMTPHVMEQIRDSNGQLVRTYTPTVWLRSTTPLAAAQVISLMRGVVTDGTATPVGFPPQDDVAAKTGTAQTGNAQNNDWMIALAPASDPKVAVAVVLPNQLITNYGATIAGPIVKAMISAALAGPPAPTGTTAP